MDASPSTTSAQTLGSTVVTELAGQSTQMTNSVRKHEVECWTESTNLLNPNAMFVQKDKKQK